jgi:hypothetical protein
LVGVPTGAASGFDIIDIDPRNGGAEWYHSPEGNLLGDTPLPSDTLRRHSRAFSACGRHAE